jgi:hypothetical protein
MQLLNLVFPGMMDFNDQCDFSPCRIVFSEPNSSGVLPANQHYFRTVGQMVFLGRL